jgi:serine/threonine protein kinase
MGGGSSRDYYSSSETSKPTRASFRSICSFSQPSSFTALPTPQQLYEDLQIDYLLGEGGYSQVYHGVSISNPQQQLAIKIVNLRKFLPRPPSTPQSVANTSFASPSTSPHQSTPVVSSLRLPGAGGISKSDLDSLKTILNELKVFQAIETVPFTVKLFSAFRYSLNCYFVMECLSGGDLRNLLRRHGPLNESTVAYLVGCIGSALHHIHERGVIHRDIKPENIGINSLGRPCLTDFGISMVATVDNPVPLNTSSSGTLPYLAPEVLGPGNCHSYQADYWSLGIMTYELLFKHRPFDRHCPLSSIHFVANEYGWMWSDLLHRSRHPFSSSSSVAAPGVAGAAQDMLSPSVNFEAISRPDDWVRPFPDCQLLLSDDGLPPSSLIAVHEDTVPFDNALQCSDEMRSLLNGLLDVRIPLRLGSLSRYCAEFEGHPCFKKYGYDIPFLPTLDSPLSHSSFQFPQPTARLSSLNLWYAPDDDLNNANFVEQIMQPLNPRLRNELLHLYHFQTASPHSHPRDRLKLPTLETGATISTSVPIGI